MIIEVNFKFTRRDEENRVKKKIEQKKYFLFAYIE